MRGAGGGVIEFSEDDEIVIEGGFALNSNKEDVLDEDAYALKL